jgi:hypothetical protein
LKVAQRQLRKKSSFTELTREDKFGKKVTWKSGGMPLHDTFKTAKSLYSVLETNVNRKRERDEGKMREKGLS